MPAEGGDPGIPEPLILVDGYSLIYRSYFAFIKRPLRNPAGENSSAVFGFFRSLFQLIKARRPPYLAVIMDSRVPTHRHLRYPQYKANREKAPQDLHAQVPVIEEILKALPVQVLRRDGFEADDLMATLAERCRADHRPCLLLSGDKDLLQLVGEGTSVLTPAPAAEDFSLLDREGVYAARGIWPEQIVDYLALAGDASDNIPGVSGVGDKTAVKLLARFGSLDGVYARLDEVEPESLKRKLADGRENALLSRELVRLDREVPLEAEIDALKLDLSRPEQAFPLLARQGMKGLVEELGGRMEDQVALSFTAPGAYPAILEERELKEWVEKARRARLYAFDTETDSLDEITTRPVGFSLAVGEGRACYIPVRCRGKTPLDEELVRGHLRGLLEDPGAKLIGQNIKFDYKVMKGWGISMANPYFDTMVAAWVLDSERSSYSLDSLAEKLLGFKTLPYGEVVAKGQTLADVDLERAADYSGEDADLAFRLQQRLSAELEREGLDGLFHELEMPLIRILAEMELAGIRLDPRPLERYGLELKKDLAELEREIFKRCGRSFNIRSTRELQDVLFGQLKLTPTKKIKTGYSTDTSVLEELALDESSGEIPQLLLRHRLLSKLSSTYVDALPGMVSPATGRLHTHYLQTGTATGRLSSKDPNLQNIPVRDEEGRRIREAFVPASGCRFLSADYSQIELVVLAHLSGDPVLRQAFHEGRDVHRQTASLLFGVPEDRVDAAQRRMGKTINFGVIYGMSAFRLARDFRISRREAQSFIDRYFERYPGVRRFTAETVRKAEENGFVETLKGRRRRIPQISSRNRTERMAAERVAVNTPVQGSAADIVKLAMLRVTRRLAEESLKARLLLQVHDELIFEVEERELKRAGEVIRSALEDCIPLSVPLRIGLETGSSWGELH